MDKFVCRTCLYVSQNITNFRTVEKVKNTLELLVPEIKQNIAKESIICTQCYYFLKNIENFKRKCIDNHKMLMNPNVFAHPNASFFHYPIQSNQLPQYSLQNQTFYDGRQDDSRDRAASSSQHLGIHRMDQTTAEQPVVILPSTAAGGVPEPAQQKQESKFKNDSGIRPTTSKQLQRISVIKNSRNVEDTKKCSSASHKMKISKYTNINSDEIIEISSDEEVEMNDESRLWYSDDSEGRNGEEDDVFEEKTTITIVKNEPDSEANPSFFNRKSGDGFYVCKLCTKKHKNSKGLYEHTLAEHNELKFFHCKICNFFSLWKSALSRHKSLFHAAADSSGSSHTPPSEDIFLFCYHCAYKTKSKEVLIKHIRGHFNSQKTTYTCRKCHRNFHRKDQYESHVEAHEKGKVDCCAHCKQFYSKKYLRQHLSEAHGVLYEKYSMYQNTRS